MLVTTATCSQCGRKAPAEPDELARWRHGDLALAGELDEVSAGLLLCPDCLLEGEAKDYEEGGGA